MVYSTRKSQLPRKKALGQGRVYIFREMGWFYGKTGVFALKKINAQDVKRNIVFEGTALYV